VVVTEIPELGRAAEHAARLDAAQLGLLDRELARQPCAHPRERDFMPARTLGAPQTTWKRPAPSLTSHTDSLLGVGMRVHADDLAHHHAAELCGDRS
jgi:hypothetical protein